MNSNSSDPKAVNQSSILPNWLYKFIDTWGKVLSFGSAPVFLLGGTFAKVLAVLMIALVVVISVHKYGLNSIKNDIKSRYYEALYKISRIDNLKIGLYTAIFFLGYILVTILGNSGFFSPITEKFIFLKRSIKDVVDIAFGNTALNNNYLQSISVCLLVLSTLVIFQLLSSLGASNSARPEGYIEVFDIYISSLLKEHWSEFLQWLQTQNRQNVMPADSKEGMESWRTSGLDNDFRRTVEVFSSLSKEVRFKRFSSGTLTIYISSSQALKLILKKDMCKILRYALDKYIKHELLGIKYPEPSYSLCPSDENTPLIEYVSFDAV